MLKIRRLLPCVFVLMAQNIFAQADTGSNKEVINVEASSLNEVSALQKVRPVEVGAGGNLKLERKYRTTAESNHEWHVHMLWESRYVTEGRDNLSGSSLVSASTEFSIDEFSVVPWIANSSTTDYTEFDLNIVYGTKLTEQLILYGGYGHIRSDQAGVVDSDNELSLDLAYRLSKNTDLLASAYHSLYVDGSFMEVALKYKSNPDRKLHYSMQGLFGVNADYIPDGHNGFNHLQIRSNISYHPVVQLELYAYAGYNRAINRDAVLFSGDQLLKNFFWGGVGFSYLF